MTTHYLKCWPVYFGLVLSGAKQFELRKNDRNYQVGDVLILCEYDPDVYERHLALLLGTPLAVAAEAGDDEEVLNDLRNEAMELAYTGARCRRVISCIVADGPWLTPGYVAMGLREE